MTELNKIDRPNAYNRGKDAVSSILIDAIEKETFEKSVFSRPIDKGVKKSVLSLFIKKEEKGAQLEEFLQNGKALHRNYALAELSEVFFQLLTQYRQCDIITTGGSCSVMVSRRGELHISNKINAFATGTKAVLSEHDRKKTYILNSCASFLYPLGVSDCDGRLLDKRRSKYRQINRFLELVDGVYDELPRENTLTVCDLCCGKSVLAFAVYWYLTECKGRKVELYGVDLKEDVISFNAEIAEKLKYDGLHFISGNVASFVPPEKPCMVLSLHACDTATDLVLSLAVKYGTHVILSTPCCHHEIFHQINSIPDQLISAYSGRSILSQKLADSLTDGLRAARLEMEGYTVDTIELVDPDDTPKNVLLRAVRNKKVSDEKKHELRRRYDECCGFFGISPSLDRLV